MKAFTTISTLVALVATFASAAPTGEVESLERRGEYSPVALDPSCIIDAPCLRTANVGTVDQCKAICNFEEECKSIVTVSTFLFPYFPRRGGLIAACSTTSGARAFSSPASTATCTPSTTRVKMLAVSDEPRNSCGSMNIVTAQN